MTRNILDLQEAIPLPNLKAALKTKGSTLVFVKKRELDEIRENLLELANLLSNKLQKSI